MCVGCRHFITTDANFSHDSLQITQTDKFLLHKTEMFLLIFYTTTRMTTITGIGANCFHLLLAFCLANKHDDKYHHFHIQHLCTFYINDKQSIFQIFSEFFIE
ncbi:hypothetical protein M9Y10_020870 [Tritrichomonas musculus]|uniref:Uncharacterized protein n=1 Tax=Tritrichomonas musculus TaxID=1915356 RepID=A0ABR2HEV3_9EUKA